MSRQQLANVAEHCLGSGRVTRAQHFRQNGLVRACGDQIAGEDRFDFRGEQQRVARPAPVQRLDAEAIANEQEAAFRSVPDRERKHPAQPVYAIVAPLLVGVNDCFGIASGSIAMAARLELAAHLGVVIDLAVKHNPHGAGFVRRRLLSRTQVDDAQAAVCERGMRIDVQSGLVWSAMGQDVAHPDRARRCFGIERLYGNESGDSTHD